MYAGVCVCVRVCALVSVGSPPLSLSAYSFEAGKPKVYIFSISLDSSKPHPPPVSAHLRAVISGEC